MKLSLSNLFAYLIGKKEKRFYASVLNALHRVADPAVATMAVGVSGDRLTLYYSPDYLKKMYVIDGVYTVEHEALHLILNHIPRFYNVLASCRTPEQRKRAKRVFPIAADCAVNVILRQNSDWAKAAPYWKDDPFPEKYGMPDKQTLEYYMAALMAKPEAELPEGNENEHILWVLAPQPPETSEAPPPKKGKGKKAAPPPSSAAPPAPARPLEAPVDVMMLAPEELKQLANQITKQTKNIVRAAVKAGGAGKGDVPRVVHEWLDAHLEEEPVVPWWEVMTDRIQASRRTKYVRSYETPNRSLLAFSEEDPSIIPARGTVTQHAFRIFVLVDVSGSMSNKCVQIGFHEVQSLMETDDDIEVRVMQGDTEVHFDQVFQGSDKLPFVRHGCGGTSFNAYFEYMQQYMENHDTAPDLVVVFTDGGDSPISPEFHLPTDVPVLWLLTPSGYGHHLVAANYGDVMVCDRDQTREWAES